MKLWSLFSDIREHCRLIERSVLSRENRYLFRVLRALFQVRQRLNAHTIKKIIYGYYTHSNQERETLLKMLPPIKEGVLRDTF